jgi:hypothetical protein
MTQEVKELLLKDLCSRLPYGVKGIEANTLCLLNTVSHFKSIVKNIEYKIEHLGFKPYLFPLSSMTEEQKVIYGDFCYAVIHSLAWDMQAALDELFDWLNKNHFDYRGLIPRGLALDATDLNIY